MWTSYVAPVLSPALLYRTKCVHAVQQQYRIRACLVDGPKSPKGKIFGWQPFGVQTMCHWVASYVLGHLLVDGWSHHMLGRVHSVHVHICR